MDHNAYIYTCKRRRQAKIVQAVSLIDAIFKGTCFFVDGKTHISHPDVDCAELPYSYLVCSGIMSLMTSTFGSGSSSRILFRSAMCQTTGLPPPILLTSTLPESHEKRPVSAHITTSTGESVHCLGCQIVLGADYGYVLFVA